MFELRAVDRPYPGLRAFEPHEAEIFFGREAHTDRLLGILQRERFLAVIGPSGSGKSSLVRAGLLPGLAMGSLGTGSDWRIALLRPGDRPMRSLAAALLQPEVLGRHLLSHDGEPDAADIAALEAELRRGPLALATLCAEAQRRHRADAGDGGATTTDFNLLVLVDQFEEIFTYADAGGQQAADESDAFVSLLLAARADAKSRPAESGLHVALTMRTDFLGNCVRFFDLPEAINQAQYLTPRLKRDEIERAIRGPAELWSGHIADSLVAELINATGQSADQLPLVQHALARMWDEAAWRDPPPPVVDWPVAEAIGGVAGAVAKHAQEIWDTLDPVEQFIVTGIFSAITERRAADAGGQAVRRPQTLARIASWLGRPSADLKPLVERYAAADVCFLQFRAPLTDDSIVDISHEAVIRQWPALGAWVDLEAERAAALLEYHRKTRLYRGGQTSLLSGADLLRACEWSAFGVLRKEGQEVGVADGWAPTAAWAQRYLGDAPLTTTEAAELTVDARVSADPLVVANARLVGLKAYIWDSQQSIEQAQRAEAERLEREANYQRQLAEAAQTQALRARRQTIFFALFGALAVASALSAGWSWQRAEKSRALAVDSALRAEASASAALAAKFTAIKAASSEAEAASAAARNALKATAEARRAKIALGIAKEALIEATAWRLVSAGESATRDGDDEDIELSRRIALTAHRLHYTPESLNILQRLASDRLVRTIDTETEVYTGYAYSPDGKTIGAGTYHGEIVIRDSHTGKLIGIKIQANAGPIDKVVFSPNGQQVACVGQNGILSLWDVRQGQTFGQPAFPAIRPQSGRITSVAFSHDGRHFVSAGTDKTLQLWDAMNGSPIGRRIDGHTAEVWSVDVSPNDEFIVSGSSDRTVRLWKLRTGLPVGMPFLGHERGVLGVSFSPDGKRIASASSDRTVRLWSAQFGPSFGKPIGQPMVGHEREVYQVAFSPDGDLLASYGSDDTLRMWDARVGSSLGQPVGSSISRPILLGVAFSPDGQHLASNCGHRQICLWDARPGPLFGHPIEEQSREVLDVSFSPDGQRLVSGSGDGVLRRWVVNSGMAVGDPILAHEGAITSVAFSPNGNIIATAGKDRKLRLWDAKTGASLGEPLDEHKHSVASVAFSPEGRRLAIASWDNSVRLWNIETRQSIGNAIVGHDDTVTSIVFSPDGLTVISGSSDRTIRRWDTRTGRLIGRPLLGHQGAVIAVAISPDGKQIASAGADRTVRLWEADSGVPVALPFRVLEERVTSIAFSPDGRHLAIGSREKRVRLLDVRSGKWIGSPIAVTAGGVRSVRFSPKGHLLAIATGNDWIPLDPNNENESVPKDSGNKILVLNDPIGWIEDACSKLGRNFSPEEWDHYVGKAVDYVVQCPQLPVPKLGEYSVVGKVATSAR